MEVEDGAQASDMGSRNADGFMFGDGALPHYSIDAVILEEGDDTGSGGDDGGDGGAIEDGNHRDAGDSRRDGRLGGQGCFQTGLVLLHAVVDDVLRRAVGFHWLNTFHVR